MSDSAESTPRLKRQLGLTGAVMVGLGSILGTGVFVSLGIATGIAGPSVLIAIVLAGLLALCNGLNSAQLAASHPVSGGTYEYGYKYLNPTLGFTAGWMFLCAKSASAAAAALGLASFLLRGTFLSREFHTLSHKTALILIAIVIVAVVMALAATGSRLSSRVNIKIVSVTILSLLFFLFACLWKIFQDGTDELLSIDWSFGFSGSHLLEATALMFVAYTGYGRIATLGEEVHEPRRTIPKALLIALGVAAILYFAVGFMIVWVPNYYTASDSFPSLDSLGPEGLESWEKNGVTLDLVSIMLNIPALGVVITFGAMAALTSVLLNLILGLSRVVLAMARRRDMPGVLATLNEKRTTPYWAVLLVAGIIIGLVLIGDIKTTWSFSAFTVLVYYAITNLAALRLPANLRIYPRWLSVIGLASCLFLAFWIDMSVCLVGLAVLGVGLVWHGIARMIRHHSDSPAE